MWLIHDPNIYATQRHALVGFGIENKATFSYLLSCWVSPEYCTIFDKRSSIDDVPGWVATVLGYEYLRGEDFNSFDVVWFTPWLTKHLAILDWAVWSSRLDTVLRTHLDEFCSLYHGTIIGVTWSKGKSTTASMIAHMLERSWISVCLAWNVWLPLLEQFSHYRDAKVFVIELSSYMLEASSLFRCDIGVLTTLTKVHLREHWDYSRYIAAKLRVFEHATKKRFLGSQAREELLHLGFLTALDAIYYEEYGYWWAYLWETPYFKIHGKHLQHTISMQVLWDHNRYNASVCFAIAEYFDITIEQVVDALASFSGLDHRLQLVKNTGLHIWYDDAIATTPLATLAAVNSFNESLWCIFLGGTEGEYVFDDLIARLVLLAVPCIVLFPDTGSRIFGLLQDAWYTWQIFQTQSMIDAVQRAAENTPEQRVILLSCGSPSFSLWNNYIHKWEQFIHAVEAL
jgi:UDP-N-acetylmuramoyl-L-alanine---L-glutamate ligase